MGNINRVGSGSQFKPVKNTAQEEVKGAASSKETQASTKAASSLVGQQNAEDYRILFVKKFGKEMGNEMADALDALKKKGKYLTFEAVKEAMEGIFEKASNKYKEALEYIDTISLFPPEIITPQHEPKVYDPNASEKMIIASKQKVIQEQEKTKNELEKYEQKKMLDEQKNFEERSHKTHKKLIRDPKKRV